MTTRGFPARRPVARPELIDGQRWIASITYRDARSIKTWRFPADTAGVIGPVTDYPGRYLP